MGLLGSIGHFLGNAAKTAGRIVGAPIHIAATATGFAAQALGQIPVVGHAIHGVFDIAAAPFGLASAIAHGERIDRAALGGLRRVVSDVQEVAPYATSVVALVPGIGSTVSASLTAGLELAQGKSITEALKSAVLAALPGGSVAKTAFDVGSAAVQGKPLGAVLAALPIPEAAKTALGTGLRMTADLASGTRVDKALLSRADELVQQGARFLPTDARRALLTGVALEHGALLQAAGEAGITSPGTIAALETEGAKIAAPGIVALRRTLPDVHGFNLGLGVMQRSGVTPLMLAQLRNKLPTGVARKGFDLALAQHIGAVVSKAPKRLSPAAQAAFFASVGMHGAALAQREGVLHTIAVVPSMRAGISAAVTHVRSSEGFWTRVFRFFGF
jgi:hypothetical protein